MYICIHILYDWKPIITQLTALYNTFYKSSVLQDSNVHVYSLAGGSLQEIHSLSQTGSITCLSYSPDGSYLAAGDSNRKVELYTCSDYKVSINGLISCYQLIKWNNRDGHLILIYLYAWRQAHCTCVYRMWEDNTLRTEEDCAFNLVHIV